MYCSNCKNVQLEPQELEPGLIVAGCPVCQGTLVSLINYRFWHDRYADKTVANEVEGATEVKESESVHSCPKCSRLMLKYQIGPESNHKLDLCPSCDEAWLDQGEWQLLKRLDLHGKLPKIFTDAWQRNIRKQRQENSINDRYEKLLGEDVFDRARDFKEWLYEQPQVDDIKQYLITHND